MAKSIVWITDCHLSFLEERDRQAFYNRIANMAPSAVTITGDIGKGLSTIRYLEEIAWYLSCPVFFVLGNHDFWVLPSLKDMRAGVSLLCEREPSLVYVTQRGICPLTERTCVIGHDGWPDARLGNIEESRLSLNDFVMIEEVSGPFRFRASKMQVLADEAARHVAALLPEALARYEHVYVLTHVPPFAEACIHEGHPTDADGLPYFASKVMGDEPAVSCHRAAGRWKPPGAWHWQRPLPGAARTVGVGLPAPWHCWAGEEGPRVPVRRAGCRAWALLPEGSCG